MAAAPSSTTTTMAGWISSSSADEPSKLFPPDASNRLYKNNRDGTFTDVTKEAGLWDAGWAVGVCVGRLQQRRLRRPVSDLLRPEQALSQQRQRHLHRCHRESSPHRTTRFDSAPAARLSTTTATACSICSFQTTSTSTWRTRSSRASNVPNCNYEGVAGRMRTQGIEGAAALSLPEQRRRHVHRRFEGIRHCGNQGLLRPDRRLRFDVDEDGWPDLFVACDTTQSLLLLNNHDGTFREEGLMRGVAISPDGKRWREWGLALATTISMGTSTSSRRTSSSRRPASTVTMARATLRTWRTRRDLAGERTYVSWGTGMVDLDNDGYPDIFWVTGNVYAEVERINPKFPYKGPARSLSQSRKWHICARWATEPDRRSTPAT